jgi:N-acetylglutamate synthase-like GNAT family acetyltransferase
MRQAEAMMDEKKFRIIELSSDNIGSFDLYIPRKMALMILKENVFGYGVCEGDLVSALILAEKIPSQSAIRIIWLYVDEEVRGQGLSDALYEKVLEEYKEARIVYLQYFYPLHEMVEEYFLHKGFETFTKASPEGTNESQEIHMALKRTDDLALPFGEAQALYMAPDLGWQLPRLLAVGEYLSNMGLSGNVVISYHEEPFIAVPSEDGSAPVRISVALDEKETEQYTLVLSKKENDTGQDAVIMVPVSEGIIGQAEFEDVWNCLKKDVQEL